MTAILLGLAALLVASTVVVLVVALRRRPRAIETTNPAPRDAAKTTLNRLGLGAEVLYDDREWVVVGTQRFAASDAAPAWTAWHLDLKGQPGWMATVAGDEQHVIFAVGAEKADTIDPTADPVVWRGVPWTPVTESTPGLQTAAVEGQRRRRQQPLEDLTADPVERITFTRDDLPRRRLVLERSATDTSWTAWIGDRISAGLVHVTDWPAS